MPLIQQAIAIGWTSKQILNFISGKIKNFDSGLNNARSSGYTDKDILKFIQGKMKTGKVKEPETAYGKYLKKSGLLTPEESKERKGKGIKAALGAGAAALGAYQAYKQFSPQGLQTIHPDEISQVGEQIGFSPKGIGHTPQLQLEGPQPEVPPQDIQTQPGEPPPPPQQPLQTPEVPTPGTDDITLAAEKEVLEAAESGLTDVQKQQRRFLDRGKIGNRLKVMKKAGKTKEQMVEFLKKSMPMMDQEYIRGIGFTGEPGDLDKRLGEMVDSYFPLGVGEKVEEPPIEQPEVPEIVEQESPEIVQPQEIKLAPGSRIITDDGDFGTIDNLPGKTAKIDVDGKKSIVQTDDLIPVPENEEEVLDIYEKLVNAIPKEYKSAMLNWVGYDSGKKLLQVKFHSGDSYTYEDIPEEFVKKLEDVLFIAKTTGGNFYGSWAQGEESRGAGVSAFIKDLQKQFGRGQEYTAKFKEVYSFFGLPEGQLRDKKKREREEAKEKRKRERQEKKKKKR